MEKIQVATYFLEVLVKALIHYTLLLEALVLKASGLEKWKGLLESSLKG
jgi:hypothetical protein